MIPLGEIIKLQSYPVAIAENDPNSDTLIATVCICDFNTNKNGVRLNRETIENWLSTLVNKPLVGKLKIKPNGIEDFTGHNVTRSIEVDENGDEYVDYVLDTSAFGTFTNARIETLNGAEYIVADATIWKRFKNACATILRRIDEGTLSTSWEIQVEKSHYEIEKSDPVKVIDNGVFIGHAMLGEDVAPAYDCSRLLDCANESDETLIAAIIRDFFASDSDINSEKGGKIVDDIKEMEVTEQENQETVEVEEEKVITEESEQETVQDAEQNETVENEESSESNTEETAEQEEVEQRDYAKELSEKDDALIKANETIESMKQLIAELNEIKAMYDAIIAEENKKKHDAEVEQLKSYVIKSNRFTAEEIASEPISTMISELKTIELKAMIADRIVDSMTEDVLPDVSESQSKKIQVNINSVPSDASASDIMRNFFDD